MMLPKKGYWLLFVLTILFTVLAIVTILPDVSASKYSRLGYKAHCSFAPISTAIFVGLSAITCTTRKRLFTSKK